MRTPGHWGLRGYQVRADDGRGKYVANYMIVKADGRALAAVPELLELLDNACASLDAAERATISHCTADKIRLRLHELGIWLLREGLDAERDDPVSLDPLEEELETRKAADARRRLKAEEDCPCKPNTPGGNA